MNRGRDFSTEIGVRPPSGCPELDTPDSHLSGHEKVAGQYCPLCGAEGIQIGTKDEVKLRVCCDSLLSWNWPSEETYEAWYCDPEAYHVIEPPRNGQRPFVERVSEHTMAAQARLAVILSYQHLRDDARVLDVGSGTGMFVKVAHEQYGYYAEGIEPSGALVQWAQSRNLHIRQGNWRLASDKYTLITMFDVLEHLTRPMECLRHLGDCLEPEGLLVVEMPEWQSPHQLQYGLEWRHIKPREHVWLPSRQTAEALFERAGYQVMAFYRPLRGKLGKATWFLAAS